MNEQILKMYAWGRMNILSPLEKHRLTLYQRRRLEIWMLLQLIPDLEYDREFTYFIIPRLKLPLNIKQRHSRLLVELPIGEHHDESYPIKCPDTFYLDAQVQDLNGNFIVEELRGLNINWELFNDRLVEGYGRFLLPVKKWNLSWDIISGDNLVSLVQNITFTMTQFGRRQS